MTMNNISCWENMTVMKEMLNDEILSIKVHHQHNSTAYYDNSNNEEADNKLVKRI